VAEIRIRQAADLDLTSILQFSIAQFGRETAQAYLRGINKAFDMLSRHPEAGELRPEIDPPIRCLPYRSHRIFYDLDGDTVWIVRVLHHAMDIETRLR
jgi:toxin ParE1/3/4